MLRTYVLGAVVLVVFVSLAILADPTLTGFAVASEPHSEFSFVPDTPLRAGTQVNVSLPTTARITSIRVSGTGILTGSDLVVAIGSDEYAVTRATPNALTGLVTGAGTGGEEPLDPDRVLADEPDASRTPLRYGDGPYDVDNDGIVGPNDAVDFIVDTDASCVIWTVVSATASLFCRGSSSCCRDFGFVESAGEPANELILTRELADGTSGTVLAREPDRAFSEHLSFSFAGTPERYVELEGACADTCLMNTIGQDLTFTLDSGIFTFESIHISYIPYEGDIDDVRAQLPGPLRVLVETEDGVESTIIITEDEEEGRIALDRAVEPYTYSFTSVSHENTSLCVPERMAAAFEGAFPNATITTYERPRFESDVITTNCSADYFIIGYTSGPYPDPCEGYLYPDTIAAYPGIVIAPGGPACHPNVLRITDGDDIITVVGGERPERRPAPVEAQRTMHRAPQGERAHDPATAPNTVTLRIELPDGSEPGFETTARFVGVGRAPVEASGRGLIETSLVQGRYYVEFELEGYRAREDYSFFVSPGETIDLGVLIIEPVT